MQQTDKYQLNLIETSDTFSPAPLNENAQKLEAALSAEASTRQAETAGLEERVSVLEIRKIVIGSAPKSGTVELGFTPKVVIAQGISVNTTAFGGTFEGRAILGLNIVEGGFHHDSTYANCNYIAFF